MKKLLSALLSTLSIAGTLMLSIPQSASASSNLSPHGQEALRQIAECINRDDKDTLNVLYLIDESGSLDWNDKNDVRADALVSSLRQFAEASAQRPYFKINRAFASFASVFTVRKPWESLNLDTFDRDKEWILEEVPQLKLGERTNWEAGLRGAQDQFIKKQKPSSCEILVWFTDGAINVSQDSRDTNASLVRICGRNPVNGKVSGNALIDEMRNSDIWIQGILLRNDRAQEKRYEDDPETLAEERRLMRFFQPIVEYSSPDIDYKCGNNVGAYGLVQTVTDPVDIIWPTQEFNCLSTNGRVIDIANREFTIDPGISRFAVTSYRQGLQLRGPTGEVVATEDGPKLGDVQVISIDRGENVVQVSGEIFNKKGSVTSPGKWRITGQSLEKAIVCVYIDLEIQLSSSTCYAGETCEFSGTVTRNGLTADLSDFKSLEIRAGEVTRNTVAELPRVRLEKGSFTSQFRSQLQSSSSIIGAQLQLETKSGIEFSISTKRDINVIPAGIYPEISPDPILESDFDGPLDSKAKEAIATVNFIAPSRTVGKICIQPLQVRNDPQPERINAFRTFIDNTEISSEKCFDLKPGIDQEVSLKISNDKFADGLSQGFLPVTYSAPDKPEIESRVDVRFESSIVRDAGKRTLVFLILMLLGIGLPLLALYLVNAANAKLFLKNLYLAQIPVVLSANGDVVSVERSDKTNDSRVVSQNDFVPFISGPKREKSIGVSSERLEGKAPLNPFGLLKAILTTSVGSVVASNALGSTRGMPGNQALGSLNPSGLVYLAQSVSTNEKLQKQNKGGLEEAEVFEGRLVVLLSLDSDPYQQVERINDDIQMNGGWLGQLLDERMKVAPTQEKQTKVTPKTINTSKEEIDAPEPSPRVSDGWDDDVSQSSQSASDGWGDNSSSSSSSSSKDDDW